MSENSFIVRAWQTQRAAMSFTFPDLGALDEWAPNVLAGLVDIPPFTVLCDNVGKTMMEVFGPAERSWLDDGLSVLVDIFPVAIYLDCSQTFGEMVNEVELGLDDDLTSVIDEAVFTAEFPASQTFTEVAPDCGAVLFVSRNRRTQDVASGRVYVAAIVLSIYGSEMFLKGATPIRTAVGRPTFR